VRQRLEVALLELKVGVNDILVLASHLVEHEVDTRLASLLESRGVLVLLTKSVHLGVGRGRELLVLAHATVQVHAAKLLGSEGEELLLELLLPLGKVQLGCQELSGHIGVHLAVVKLERGRGQDLVVERWLLLLLLLLLLLRLVVKLIHAGEAGTDGSLGDALAGTVVVLSGEAVVVVRGWGTEVVLALRVGSRRRGLC
jgi:hypothetical protein